MADNVTDAAVNVFDMNVEQLRSEYHRIAGHSADEDGLGRKPVLKATLIMLRVGVPTPLHAGLLDRVVNLNSLRLEHLRAQVFQQCKIGVDSLGRQELVEAMITRKLWKKAEGKAQP